MTALAISYWRDRPAAAMAGLGLISGILSAIVGFNFGLPALEPVAAFFFFGAEMLPIGFFFGAVVTFGVWFWAGESKAAPLLFLTTMWAWSAAVHTALRLHKFGGGDAVPATLIVASIAAGIVGAGLTQLGAAVLAPGLRGPLRFALTCAVGGVAGLMLYLGEMKIVDSRMLFVVWQPAVAYCLGLGLGRPGAINGIRDA
ncbi:MAG: hypothetical protein F9K29_20250 [Hyphomicrobiaceae bacterium]|nr:MAG: hypothetical protein F9K29_20250 [Hyphomicrobiaceae bacterium]